MSKQTKFSHPDIDGVACLLAAIIAGAAFWWGVWPLLHAEDEAQHLAKQMAASQAQLDAARADYLAMRAKLVGTQEQLDRLAVILDDPDQLSSRQAQIGRAFTDHGIEVGQLTVGTIEHGPLLDLIPLRLSGSGAFPDLVATMHLLRDEFPDMAITAFQIAGSGGRGGSEFDGVSFSLGIAWYVARDETSPG